MLFDQIYEEFTDSFRKLFSFRKSNDILGNFIRLILFEIFETFSFSLISMLLFMCVSYLSRDKTNYRLSNKYKV